LRSLSGERHVPLNEFYTGVRGTVMHPDEVLVDIAFPALKTGQRGTFIKLGLRRAQAISLVNASVLLELDGNLVKGAAITLGAVAPTIIHAAGAEAYLVGKRLTEETIYRAATLAIESAHPIDDLRSTALYRDEMVRICTLRALRLLEQGRERVDYPPRPVLLGGSLYPGSAPSLEGVIHHGGQTPIISIINGRPFVFKTGHDKTLLRLLREDAGLIGTKEGCAEGECGACEVFLDGMAVMSCLVPAPRAHRAQIVTIEGLGDSDDLHPVQKAFIAEGAVQCGYCTPGFVMSGTKLLEELPNPTRHEIQQAISGNLCRCTGYYSIVNAIERAALASGNLVQVEG
jgi:xanthine dehydrogenase iron-sulfur cluster and FAD-binding subunit A